MASVTVKAHITSRVTSQLIWRHCRILLLFRRRLQTSRYLLNVLYLSLWAGDEREC